MVGDRALQRFTLEERLGSGGHGSVYRAWDEKLQRAVAVKRLEGDAAGPRVLREAQAAARLSHPGIVTLYEIGRDGSGTFLVSELVEGETLRELSLQGALSDRAVGEIGASASEALVHAHSEGVVHRDVKPQNIMVPTATSEAKLVDFGIARLIDEPTLTATGNVLGTIAYMAPEQADGERPGPAADVYALALTLYECWSGEQPILRGSPAATARAIGERLPSLADLRPDLPPALVETIDAALLPDPDRRPSAAELEHDLGATVPSLAGDPLPPPATPEAPAESPARVRRPSASLLGLLPALCVASAAVATIIATGAGPAWGYSIPIAGGLLALARVKLSALATAAALVGWLAAASRPGAALVLAVLAAPLAALPASPSYAVLLPGGAPALAALGIGPLYPAIAGWGGGAAQRLVTGAGGYLWLVAAELVFGTTLLLGVSEPAAAGWSLSVGDAAREVLLPLLGLTTLLGAAIWAAAALALPHLVRGRLLLVDLLGAVVWAAGLLAAHRLLLSQADVGPTAAGGPLIAALLAACLAVLLTWIRPSARVLPPSSL